MARMKRFFFLILLLIVSACGTSPTAFDPNLNAIQQEMTAQAAQNQAQLFGAMATGTAQAPIIAITQQAAALSFSMTQNSISKTEVAALWTPTNTPVPTITASPTANATTTAIFNASRAESTQIALSLERAEMTNKLNAFKWYTVGVVFLITALTAAYMLIKRFSFIDHKVDERGKVIPMVSVLEGVAFDIDRAANGVIGTTQKFLKQLPAITAERQDPVTARAQLVDMATRTRLTQQMLKKIQGQSTLALPAPDEEQPLLIDYPLPEWNVWMQHWKPGYLALGINEKGLLLADPESHAHFLFAGTTGSWKTRGGVRVVVTCALASGWQVIIAGKQLDYKIFEHHPNAHLVPFSLLKDPTRAIDLLRSVYAEIERRDKMMSNSGYSLWSQTGQGHTMVVVDEFSNLADALEDIDAARREELWRWARMDTAEARKYGMHMVYALQDPTAKSIDLRIRRNTTPIMFRVKDAASSRTLLNASGAEMLSARHFLVSMVKLERGAAFAPTDEEIRQFLNAHPAPASETPSWVEGVLVQQPSLPDAGQESLPAGNKEAETVGEWLQSLDEKSYKVIELYLTGGKSNTEIGRLVYGYSNSTVSYNVRTAIEEYKRRSRATTTTTTALNMPDLSAAAA